MLRFTILVFCLLWLSSAEGQNSSQLIYLDQGELVYEPFAMEGQSNVVNTIPDFSYAGYMGGGVALPTDIAIQATVVPEEGDDVARIQAAINFVESLEPDNNGFRGVVLIKAGHYSLENILLIRESGVVLRGEGQGLNGTVLHSNLRTNHNIINFIGVGSINKDANSTQLITNDYVAVGSCSFEIEDASNYQVGDKIVVTRTPNQTWIDELGMDQETLCAGKSDCTGWVPSSYTIDHERTITAIEGNIISVDIPIVDVIESYYGGGTITKIVSTRRIFKCGIENIRIQSFYDASTDENHAWTAIRFDNAENCWVKQVTGQYLAFSTVNIEDANFITVQDCAYIDPVSIVSGGRRYSFAIQEGIGNLFQRCYTINGRHDFVMGSRVTGPNVFLDGLAENARSDIGPHHRWATGTLFDNLRAGSTRVWNRGNSGTGHGWSGAQTMYWNIDSYSGEFRVDSPLGSINWGIGCIGTNQTGDGYWESWGSSVQPRSLYIQQLQDRLGVDALNNILIEQQRNGDIYDLLAAWAGQGELTDGGFKGDIPELSFATPSTTIDVSVWEGGDILVDATDNDGTVVSVKLLINGEPLATVNEAPYIFTNLTNIIQSLTHEVHYLQAIVTDNDGNTNFARLGILGGDPPQPEEEEEEEEEETTFTENKVYPNPVLNRQIRIEMIDIAKYEVKIYDLTGRIVEEIIFEGNEFLFEHRDLSSGLYLIDIQNDKESVLRKKIIIK